MEYVAHHTIQHSVELSALTWVAIGIIVIATGIGIRLALKGESK